VKKSKWYKSPKVKKFSLNPQLQIIHILTKDVQMLILCLSYFITTVQLAVSALLAQVSDLAPFFGDLKQSERLFKIKLPLLR
jgi:hypothetical protein